MIALKVDGMTCAHCVTAVGSALRALDPEASVEIDLASGRVSVASTTPAPLLIAALAREGYPAALLAAPETH